MAQLGTEGRVLTGARAAWEVLIGPVPEGRWVCRTCSTELCVAPIHHELRTPREHRRAVGRVRGNAKLSERSVRAIKVQLSEGGKQAAIAAAHGIAPSTVSAIHREVTWTDVPWPGGE